MRVREAEEALASRDALAAEQRGAASAEADQLRERIVALTDSNRALQVAPHALRRRPTVCRSRFVWALLSLLSSGQSISMRVLPLSSRVCSLGGPLN